MKPHSHVQSGLAISDGRWVIDLSYNSGLDPCSRKSPSPCLINTLPSMASNRRPFPFRPMPPSPSSPPPSPPPRRRRPRWGSVCKGNLGGANHVIHSARSIITRSCTIPGVVPGFRAYREAVLSPVIRNLASSGQIGPVMSVVSRINCASRKGKHVFGLSLDTIGTPASPGFARGQRSVLIDDR